MSGYIEFKKNNKFGVKDDQDNIILEPIYSFVFIDEDFIVAEIAGKYGLFDLEGNQLLPIIYNHESDLVKMYKKKLKLKDKLFKGK